MKIKSHILNKESLLKRLTGVEENVLNKIRTALKFSKDGGQAEVVVKFPPGGNVYYAHLTKSEKRSIEEEK